MRKLAVQRRLQDRVRQFRDLLDRPRSARSGGVLGDARCLRQPARRDDQRRNADTDRRISHGRRPRAQGSDRRARDVALSHAHALRRFRARRARSSTGRSEPTRPRLGLHDILFIDPSEGPDPARALASTSRRTQRLVVAADREWIERIDKTVIEVFVRGIRRRLADRLRRRADVRRLFEAPAALDQRHCRSDHRRRHSRTNAGQRPP